jgi:hypothetical protein
MLLAEDLLLLLTDDESGRLKAQGSQVDVGLAGAVVVELTLSGHVDVTGEGDAGKRGRVVVRSRATTGDTVLDNALETLAAHPKDKPPRALGRLTRGLRDDLNDRLVAAGVLRREEGRILGIFPTHRWPARDGAHEAALQGRIEQAVRQNYVPDQRIGVLIAILSALRCEGKVVDAKAHGLSRKQLKARVDEVAQGSWATDAVRRCLQDMDAAMAAAVTAATVAATVST